MSADTQNIIPNFSHVGKRFISQTIIVTGAGQGIGRATALRCAAEGANIVAVDRERSTLIALAKEIADIGACCHVIAGDISDLTTVETMIASAEQEFGRLDGLVNNAGIASSLLPFDTAEQDEFERLVETNVLPVWRSMQLAKKPMKAQGRGAIVNVASMAALRAERGVALYGMTKGAVANLTINASLDYARDGIRVNAVCPGPIETPMLGKMEQIIDKNDVEGARRKIASGIPLRRCGTIWEVANTIAFLLSEEASFLTGVLLPVDGGLSVKQ